MNLFYKRPLLFALTLFLTASILCAVATPSFRVAGLVISLSISAFLFILSSVCLLAKKKCARNLFNMLLCSLLCFAAFTSSYTFLDRTLLQLEKRTEPANITAEIIECTYSSNYSTVFTVRIEQIDHTDADFSAELTFLGECLLQSGNRIDTKVLFTPFSENIYGFNERSSKISQGILVAGEFSSYTLLEDASPSIRSVFRNLRTGISSRIGSADMPASKQLAKALLLGETADIGGTVKQDFRRLGISHILSISGTHFTTLLGMVTLLLLACGINKRTVYLLLIPLAVFYMGITGFTVTVCRAGIMCILSYWGFLCGRMRDSYTALFLSVSTILVISPYAVYSAGLWLSFTATFVILILIELFGTAKSFANKHSVFAKILFISIFRTIITIAVTLFTLPITAAFFGEISLISPFSNLFLVPLFELFLYMTPFVALFPRFLLLTKITELLGNCILSLTNYIGEVDGLLLSVKQDFVLIIAIIGIFLTLLLVALPLKKRGWVLLPSGLCILCIAIGLTLFTQEHGKRTILTCYTEGENDGIVLVDQNAALCIDISNGGSAAAYKSEYIASENFCPELDGYMFTHYHIRHVNQFLKLTNRTDVHAVYLPISDAEEDASILASLCTLAEERNIKIVRFSYGVPVSFSECTITLYPPQYISRSTHEILSLKIECNGQEFLYLGSSFHEAELSLASEISEAEYIFFGQHSPIVKKPFSTTTDAFCIFGSERLASFSEQQKTGILLGNDDQYKILLK